MISNGVINLSPEKETAFTEAARVLRPGGRLAIADIVSEQQLKDSIVCDADRSTMPHLDRFTLSTSKPTSAT